MIKEQINDLFKLPVKNWKLPFKIATKLNLGKRLSQETVTQVEELLTARTESAERSALRSTRTQTPIRQQRPATHSPPTKNPRQPPKVDEGNPIKVEKLINELTSALELFTRRIRLEGERRNKPEVAEMTTQTQMGDLKMDDETTQTETKETTTHNRSTQTEATKRLSKGVGLQVQLPQLENPEKQTQTFLTISRHKEYWDKVDKKTLKHQT